MTKLSELSKGAFFSASAKLLSKLIGLVSTLLLARMLTPSDFGIIAAISIALYFFDVFGNAATEQYIMQKSRLSNSELNTAWSINFILKCMICIILIYLSSVVANLLNKPEIATGLMVVSLVLPLNALKSPSLLQQKRMVRYQGIFILSMVEKIVAFVIVLSAALLLKSYWAFIIADLVSVSVGTLLSYVLFKKYPQFDLTSWREQFSFSGWMLGKNMIGYLRSQADTIFISRFFSANSLGQYHLSRELAMMPGHYLIAPALEPMLSALRETAKVRDYFLQQVSSALVVTFIISIPIATFLSYFANPISMLLLGKQWDMAGLVLSVLAWLVVYWGAVYVLEIALIAQGKVKALFLFDLFSLLCILGALVAAFLSSASISEVGVYRVSLGFLTTLLLFSVMYFKHSMFAVTVLSWGAVTFFISIISAVAAKFFAQTLLTLSERNDVFETILSLSLSGLCFLIGFVFGLTTAIFISRKTKVTGQLITILKSAVGR